MAHHDWQEGNLQDESDDEDYLYEGTPRSTDGLFPAPKGESAWRDSTAGLAPLEDTRGPPKQVGVKKEKGKKQERFWKGVNKVMGLVLLVLSVGLLLWCLYEQYYQECHLFLEEVKVTKLPERRFYISETVDLNLTLDIRNPNKADGHLDFVYLRLSFIDEDHQISYDVHEPLRLPNNQSVRLPANSNIKYTFTASIKIALLSEGLRVVMLLNNGCFTLSISGELTYRVSSFPHTAQVSRRQQLFGPGSCPFCGQQQIS